MQVLLSGTDFPHENGEFSPRKTVPYYGIYCFSTPFLYEHAGALHRGAAGDLLINPPGDIVFHGPVNKDVSFTNDWMHISRDFGALLERYPLPCSIALSLGSQQILSTAIRQISSEQLLQPPGFQEKIDCILVQMVIDLYRAYSRGSAQTSRQKIEAARDTILKSPGKQWTLEQMAALSGYSPSRFSALYQVQFGCSPKADLLQTRISLAKQMLRYSDLSVSAIAAACGFQSLFYFSKYFHRQTGKSPSAYREPEI